MTMAVMTRYDIFETANSARLALLTRMVATENNCAS